VDLSRRRPSGSTSQPAIHFGLNFATAHEFAWPLRQAQEFGSEQRVPGDATKGPVRHLLRVAVSEVPKTLLGQGTIALTSHHPRNPKKSVEHSQTSKRIGIAGGSTIQQKLCGVHFLEEGHAPHELIGRHITRFAT
jgi:hypothetical protein